MDRTIVAERLKKFEGSTSYMYRCTGGEVTVGVGHAILNATLAQQLAWLGSPAADLIGADYARVAAAEKGSAAAHYEPLTQCRLSDDAIDALLAADLALFEANLDGMAG